jgi:hypothetical protein
MKNIRNNSLALLTFLGGVVEHHYISKLLDYKNEMEASKDQSLRDEVVNQNFQTVIDNLKNLEKGQAESTEILNKLVEKNPNISSIEVDVVFKKIEIGNTWCEKILNFFDENQGTNINIDTYKEAFKNAKNCVSSTQEAQNSLKDLLVKYGGKNKYISDFNLSDFYNYLNNLNLLELSALFHIIVFSMLLITVFNIFSSLFGNETIKYFNLEEKYPKLSIFFQLRMKFQRYYLSLNLFIMFFICIVTIFINILVLY